MVTTPADSSPEQADPLALLPRIRAELQPIPAALNNLPLPAGDEIEAMLATARQIQRLIDGVLSEIARLAERCDGLAPTETLLIADGTVPRHQVQAEIERTRVAEAFPTTASYWRDGDAHTSNIDVLARLTRSLTEAELTAMRHEDEALAAAAGRLGEESFRKRVTRLRNKVRSDGGTTAANQVVADSFARVTPTRERDAYKIQGLLDPLRGAAAKAAIARETKFLTDHPELCVEMTPAQVAAQALHDLILRGDSVDHTSLPRASVQISVLSDRDTLEHGPHAESIAETFEGLAIGTGSLARLCCEASLRAVDTSPDAKVNVSRATRSPSQAQRAALRALYPSCPISGAGWESIEIHHVIFYEISQRTVLSELVPLSRRWHHLIHDGGWILTMDADRTLHLSHPDGTPFRTIAPPTPINQADHDLAA